MSVRRGRLLWVLWGLFLFRVLAQLLQSWSPVPFLPPFEAWHSGAIRYRDLVASQVLILVLYAWMAWGIDHRTMPPSRRLGRFLYGIGAVYFALMALRLGLGLTVLADVKWWNEPIPSCFHLVLAGFLVVAGDYHWNGPETDRPERRSEE